MLRPPRRLRVHQVRGRSGILELLPDHLPVVHDVLDRLLRTTKLFSNFIVRDLVGNEVEYFSLLLERQPHPGLRWVFLLLLLRDALFRVATRLALTIPGRTSSSGAVVILVANRAHAVHLRITLIRDLLAAHTMQCSFASSVAQMTGGLAKCWGIGGDLTF